MADYFSINDLEEINEADFKSLKSKFSFKPLKQTFRKKSESNRTMAVEAYGSLPDNTTIMKFTSPNTEEPVEYYKTDFSPTGLPEPVKVKEDPRMTAEDHEIWQKQNVVAQKKENGIRLTLIYSKSGPSWITRRTSKVNNMVTDKTGNMKWLKIPKELEGCQLDGEIIVDAIIPPNGPESTSLVNTTTILNCKPEETLRRIREYGIQAKIRFVVFDCIAVAHQSIVDKPYKERLAAATALVTEWNSPNVEVIKSIKDDKFKFYTEIVEQGLEGVVLVDTESSYYDTKSRYKIKRASTIDAFIFGFIKGQKKNEGKVGGIKLGVTLEGSNKKVFLARVNAGTDEERDDITFNLEKYVGKCFEITYQEFSQRGLQHPRFLEGLKHPRMDKSPDSCILERTMCPSHVWDYFENNAPNISDWKSGKYSEIPFNTSNVSEVPELTSDPIDTPLEVVEEVQERLDKGLIRILGQAKRTQNIKSVQKRLEAALAEKKDKEAVIWSARLSQLSTDSLTSSAESSFVDLINKALSLSSKYFKLIE